MTSETSRQTLIDRSRRRAMVWMLRAAGATYAEIGRGMGISGSRVAELANGYERRIARREVDARNWNEPWARRLRAAGAIP